MATTVKSKAPTGLAIKRNKHVYTLTWKKGDKDYGDGQTCVFRCNNDKFGNQTVSAGTTSKSVKVDYNLYYPHTSKMLSRVQFGIRGNRKAYTEKQKISGKDVNVTIDPTISDWSYAEFTFNKPQVPSVSASLSGTYSNVCTFSWTAKNDTASHTHFADCEYQTILVKDCNSNDGPAQRWSRNALGWQTGTTGATGSITITEQTEQLALDSYTRWIRVRARGARGASDWRYAKHVYARPYQAKIKTAKVKQTNAGGYLCTVEWSADNKWAHPIDAVTVQYTIVTPAASLTCPDDASWNDASITRDTSGKDMAAFSIDSVVGTDQALFVRVNTKHDSNVTYGAAKLVKMGYLSDPEIGNISIDQINHTVTITATNISSVVDSFLLLRYIGTNKYQTGLHIGVFPHGTNTLTAVHCPIWAEDEPIAFSVQAIVGTYKANPPWQTNNVVTYSITSKARSRNQVRQGGAVPTPPTDVELSMTDVVGTVQVSFNWTWDGANAAELSWANHPDAWQSTDEPETYEIRTTRSSIWNISGLEVGQTWYVRVRLIGGTEDNPIFGGYSDIVSIDLASAPITPVLSISPGIVTAGGMITATWVYVSTDTTLQESARVAEVMDTTQLGVEYILTEDTTAQEGKLYYVQGTDDAFRTIDLGIYTATSDTEVQEDKTYYVRHGSGTVNSPYRYESVSSPLGNPSTVPYYEFSGTYGSAEGYYEQNYVVLVNVETAQQVDLDVDSLGWGVGETHSLAVKVASASGRETGWSDPVTVMVAEPLVCEITATSLEEVVGGKNQFNVDALDSLPGGNGVTTTLNLKPNTTYVMSTNHPLANSNVAFVFFKLPNQEIGTNANGVWADHPHSVTTGADGLADVVCRSQDSETLETFKTYWFQVEEGSAATDYEEYTTIQALTALPLTLTVTGAGEGGTTTIAIERAEAYHVTRPDETDLHGYEGETVALITQTGEAQITVGLDDLIGRLDDGAHYRLVASISDGLGQSASETIDFWIGWEHQAIIPDGEAVLDTEHIAMMLTPIAPDGAVTGDVCDIYRLSVDKPQLIYEGAEWGETYVDPYPTIGEYGGYRFVFRSKEGDYITDSGELAWIDADTDIDYPYNIIDFGTGRVELEYNVDVSNSWKKDFKETKYLGGSVQGDWNPAVSRSSSVGAVGITTEDQETIEAMRRLAVYPGICHVRTKEGSSYPADVQVSESYAVSEGHKLAKFSLKITRVDAEGLDGMTLVEWEASHQEEGE